MKTKYFIGSLVLIGLLVLCFSMTVQGAITFPAAAAAPPYAITVTGNYGSAFLKNVAFEENRTLSSLYVSPVINVFSVGTTKDFVSPVRVTDRKGVFGSQFTCFLYAPVTFTSCVLTFPVTYFDGTTGTIAKTFTGVGTQNIGGTGVVIKDCRSVTITALVGTSFRIKVNQSFYGVIWNITRLTDKYSDGAGYFYNESFTEHDYYMEGSTFILGVNTGGVGSNMTIENSRLIFFDNPFARLDSVEPSFSWGNLFTCRRNVRLSVLNSTIEVQTTGWLGPPNNFISFSYNLITNKVKIEKSRFVSRINPAYGSFSGSTITAGSYSTTATHWDINNSFFDGIGFSSCDLRNFKNNIICNLPSQVFYMCSMGDVSNIQIINCKWGFAFFQFGFNLTTVNFDLYTGLGKILDPGAGANLNVHLIDCTSNNYRMVNGAGDDIALFARQYIFWDKTIHMKLIHNAVPLSGVTVRFYNRTGVLKSTQTTNALGIFPTVTLPKYRWVPFRIAPIDDSPYNITFSKTGYQTNWIIDFLNASINYTVPMKLNASPIVILHENLANIPSWTHEYSIIGSLIDVWFNGTGAGGSSSSGLQVINPNPGNGTCLGYNFLQANTLGTKTCVDVSYQNFTNLTISNLGNGTLIEYYNTGDNDNKTKYVDYEPNGIGQGFTIGNTGENKTSIPTKVRLKVWRNAGNTKPLNVEIRYYPYYPDIGIIVDPLTQIYTVIANGSIPYTMIPTASPGSWVTINLTSYGILLESGHFYVLWLDPESTSYMVGHVTHYYQTYLRAKTIGAYTGGHGIEECHLPAPVHWTEMAYDYLFEVYGWTFGGNITWNQTMNLTWSSNSSGVWQQYGATQLIYSNGTYCTLDTNMTSNDTQYWWRVDYMNPVESGYHVYTFTTADRKQIIPIGSSGGSGMAMSMSMGGTCGILGGLCIGMVYVRRRKKRTL